jgi:hypothetical protein
VEDWKAALNLCRKIVERWMIFQHRRSRRNSLGSSSHLDDFERLWKPVLLASIEADQYWDWEQKSRTYGNRLGAEQYAVECESLTQGLMLIEAFGTEAATVCGQQIVLERLQRPSIGVQRQFWAVLDEDEETSRTDALSPVRAQVKAILGQVLSETDWSAIAQAAGNTVQR